ncbi:hypothetical protein [Alloactinosynnema sp. L-07]|nr:hypothetical protein [Alloactinosynnema sp. L-07]
MGRRALTASLPTLGQGATMFAVTNIIGVYIPGFATAGSAIRIGL